MKVISYIKTHRRLLAIALAAVTIPALMVILISYVTISPYRRFIVSPQEATPTEVGMVLGAGVTKEGRPFKELQARLDSAADALNEGVVKKLLLSGDNRFAYYDEPTAKVFGVSQLVIFSAESHLPRAIYLCKHFNITAIGIASGVEADNSWRRELLARVKAVYNAHLIGEPTVLGDPISLQ